MKKLSIFLMSAMALGFAACDDAPATAPVQQNPQPEIVSEADVVLAPAATLAQGITLEGTTADDLIPVVDVTSVTLPEGAEPEFTFEIAKTESFDNVVAIPVTLNENIGYVSADDLNAAHLSVFGKSPKVKTVYYRVPAYANFNSFTYRLNGEDWYALEGTYEETCRDAGFVIESAYYLLGYNGNWDITGLTVNDMFKHSDKDVYDDPVFTITFNAAGNSYWKIVPQSTIDLKAQNPDINEWELMFRAAEAGPYLSGMLIEANGDAAYIESGDGGTYTMTINMETMEYNIEKLEFLCTPNAANGWTQTKSQYISFVGDGVYAGSALINPADGGFKLTMGDTWANDKTWGMGDEPGVLAQPGGNIPVEETGLYWVCADLDQMTYSTTRITSIGVIGSMTSWNQYEPKEMTPNDEFTVWTVTTSLEGEWKLIINHDWAYNYGGPSLEKPTYGGPNFSGFTGEYTVTIDFSGNFPVITVK